MTLKTEFFLGANSAEGFYSLYDQLREGERMRDLIVLKGGPGVGKSTFMRCIANQAEEKGFRLNTYAAAAIRIHWTRYGCRSWGRQ